MTNDVFMQQLAEVRAEQTRQKRRRVSFRQVTVTAADPEALTFDAVGDDDVVISGLTVDRGAQIMPSVGDRVLLTIDGATPRYDRPSRIYPAALDPITGEVKASMDQTGKVSGAEGNFETLVVGGQPFVPTAAEDQERPRGVVEYGGQYTNSPGTSTEIGVLEVSAVLEVGRLYRIETTTLAFAGATGSEGRARIRMSEDGTTPDLTDRIVATVGGTVSASDDDGRPLRRMHHPAVTGLHRFLLTVARTGGTAGNVGLTGSDPFPIQMWVEDCGPFRGNSLVLNDGSGAATTPVQTYTKRYDATWSGTFIGSAAYPAAGTVIRQGFHGDDFRGMVGFNSTQIMADLAGATVESCYFYARAKFWYLNEGGTAVLGTHTNTALPGSWTGVTPDRWRSADWPKPGGRRVSLGAAVGAEFKAGTARGIAFGPAPSTSTTYTGRFAGHDTNNRPYLEIRYSK